MDHCHFAQNQKWWISLRLHLMPRQAMGRSTHRFPRPSLSTSTSPRSLQFPRRTKVSFEGMRELGMLVPNYQSHVFCPPLSPSCAFLDFTIPDSSKSQTGMFQKKESLYSLNNVKLLHEHIHLIWVSGYCGHSSVSTDCWLSGTSHRSLSILTNFSVSRYVLFILWYHSSSCSEQ